MIPRHNLELEVSVNLKELQYPPEEVLSWEEGLVCNHEYRDMRGRSWEAFFISHRAEKYLITEAGKKARDEEEFDEILNRFLDKNRRRFADQMGLELGVSSTAIALSAYGCAPAESCRSHFDGLENSLPPHVVFWTREKKAKNLVDLAKRKLVGLINCEMEEYGALLLYAKSIPDLMDFGKALYDLYGKKGLNRKLIVEHPERIFL